MSPSSRRRSPSVPQFAFVPCLFWTFIALAATQFLFADEPETRARLGVAARETGRQYDIAAFVRKMESLYELLHRVSRPSHRKGVLEADLSFLTSRAPA